MDNKKNTFILTDLIDFLTDKALTILKKVGKLITNEKSHDAMEMCIKVIIMILIILILKIPVDLIGRLGVVIIYKIGTIFRYYLSVGWIALTIYSYYILSLVLIYKVFKDIFENKELNIIEMDRKKDKKIKKDFFIPILRVIRAIIIAMLFPIFIIIVLLFSGLGASIALLVNKTYLISLFIVIIGLIIIFFMVGYIVVKYTFDSTKDIKKYIEKLFIGFAVFIFGILAFGFETLNFSYSKSLPVNFNSSEIKTSVKYDNEREYIILKGKNNDNIIINKNIDNSLGDEIVIKGKYLETSKLSYVVNTIDNETIIEFYNDLNLDSNKIEKIYNSLIASIVDRTMYNYKKLKYSMIEIYASEDILKNIIIEDE